MKPIGFLLVFVILFFSACSKEKSSKWMVIDLSIKNGITGLPVNTYVEFEYWDGGTPFLGQSHQYTIDLGPTTDGRLKTEFKIGRRYHDMALKLFVGGVYTGGFTMHWKYKLSATSNNQLDLVWTPICYVTKVQVTNASCFDETDSLWVQQIKDGLDYGEPSLFTGCVEGKTYSTNSFDSYCYVFDSTLHLKFITKKNEVIDSFLVDIPLEHGELNTNIIDF
jgi:hypothetical protein